MTELIKKKNKVTIRPQYVVDQLLVFVKCQIVNPAFDSQTKETLNTNIKKFGSTCEIDKKFIERLANDTDLVERVLTQNEYKNNKSLKKTDGKKRMRIKVPKLDDANWAGGRKSKQCTLILTEGDSAKSMAISGLSVIGRDKYGVFPLRGKVLNVKGDDKNMGKKIAENAEITNLNLDLGECILARLPPVAQINQKINV